jgi:hypothetical protein
MSFLDNAGKADDGKAGAGNAGGGNSGGAAAGGAGADGGGRPDYIPEKFWKDGKPDVEGLGKSYSELEGWKGKKAEELAEEVRKTDRAARKVPDKPEAYALPKIEKVDGELMAKDPMVATWRKLAFEAGLGQEGFEAGIKQYVETALAGAPDLEAEKKKLGDNADVRISAIVTWAKSNFKGEELEALKPIATSAAGIQVLEKIQKMTFGEKRTDDTDGGGNNTNVEPELTPEKLKGMQGDPRYWDHARRDPEFVKQVDAGFQKLYGGKK